MRKDIKRPLVLRTQTIRQLTSYDLSVVAGGGVNGGQCTYKAGQDPYSCSKAPKGSALCAE